VRVTVRLGDVRVDGSKVEARLTGDPARPLRLEIAGAGLAAASGDVRIVSGKIDLLGRELALEPGLIRLLGGDPANPYVRAAATWASPDGTLVHVEYAGALLPVTDDKLQFRSDPPRPPREVLSLLLFGY
jgi:translocation and assembly module TamB